jgi:glutathione S-transferase
MAQQITQKTIPTLYNLSSSQAFIVLWALEEVSSSHGIDYNVENFPRGDQTSLPTLKTISPLGKSPIVTLESVAGEPTQTYQLLPNTLTESRLILQFISDNYTTGEWVPDSEEDKRRDLFFQEFAKCTLLEKVDYVVIFEQVPKFLPMGISFLTKMLMMPIVNHFKGDLADIFGVMQGALTEEKPWFSGVKMGLADFCMGFAMDMAVQRGYCDLGQFERIGRWHRAVVERPAYKRALEKGGEYELVTFGLA